MYSEFFTFEFECKILFFTMNKNNRFFWNLLAVLITGFGFSVLHATPRIQSATLMQGSSMPRIPDSTAYLHWSLENPDAESVTVTLQLEPDSGSSGAIYSTTIKLGPATKIDGRSRVSIGNAERYIVSLIQQNIRVHKTDILLRQNPRNRLNIAILTDADDLSGYSDLAKNETLYRRLQFSLIRFRNIPNHFSGFNIYDLLILFKPDLEHYSASQRRAVLDFVRQGGTIVLCAADTAFALEETELEELLPFQPVGKRIYEGLASLRQSFELPAKPPILRDDNGDLLAPVLQELLEVLSPENSTVLLRQEGRPLFCLGQAGLGSVLALCFDPFKLGKADPDLLLPIWNTIIRYSNHLPSVMQPDGTARLNETLQHLQGYVIPPVNEILYIFLLYAACGILILTVCFYLKRPALGWGILCVFGLCYTLFIFRKAQNIAVNQPDRCFTAISTGIWDGSYGSLCGTGNLFAKSDCRPTVTANAVRTFFLPPARSTEHEGGTAIAPSPLHITTNWENSSLENISIQQYRPRTLSWMRSSGKDGQNKAALPELLITENGFQLQPWQIPANLNNAQRAVLVLPGDVLPLDLHNGMISSSKHHFDGMEADLVFLSACKYIQTLRLPNPALCLISARITPCWELFDIDNGEEEFSGYDYHLEFIPVTVPQVSVNYSINPEFITLDIPPKSILRQYYQHGEFAEIMIQEGFSQPLLLDFNIHPTFHGVLASEIRIDLDISNPSGKATFELRLLDSHDNRIEALRREGNTFIFRPTATVVDPVQNKIRAVLQLNSKPGNENGISQRINSWKILACKVQIRTAELENEADAPLAK